MKYVYTKKAEENALEHGLTDRKEGQPATYGYEPVENYGIAMAWLKKGYIIEAE